MIGEIKFVAFDRKMTDHIKCDGRVVYISDYPELFDMIGHKHGENAPKGMFFLPTVPSVSTEIMIVIQTKGDMPNFIPGS